MKAHFKTAASYSLDEIAATLGKSVTNITNILSVNNIKHEGLRGSRRGPDTRIWRGQTLNSLVNKGILSRSLEEGEEIWFTAALA